MTIHENIKALAKEMNISIKDIENACGFSNGTIGKWANSFPKVDYLYKVSLFLNEPLEYFLTGVRANPTNQAECELLSKFRSLDFDGKAEVIHVANKELDRMEKNQVSEQNKSVG